MPKIEIRRWVRAVESCTVEVDDATLKTITDKAITRSELADLAWNADEYDVDVHEGDDPHSVFYKYQTIDIKE